ncbi:hypothetical protein [Saccharopolyspora mangrovi]|uniref:Uncharacterized protein n=1 Tax=Saccharopolyspora mangrovi TaxID=3082379 RepID=A0ABU6AIA0_9PSEU|nr:hypothetical protein [Saccharopolyspora sp. S2-29]MEB3371192.1 hypothetical protein [Saccharopolyspora sp. S2-29]
MAGLALLVLFLVGAAAVFVSLRHDGDGTTDELKSHDDERAVVRR